ncbi:hypothetical protein ACFXKC_22785 [Streptomyces sp. NPDC059340]|uniref:hypothetical protein n=1 Tax=Streptomyces sp. NPDC059340 TaxID=3346806 RepID=UPI0036B3C0B3
MIGPLISRAQEGRVREHIRLDYEWFSAQVYGSTSNVKVRELGEQSADIRRDIMRNLCTLDRFALRLDENSRQLLEVRLCSTSPGVTLYRWDERSLVSFLTVGRFSGEGVQLEVAVRSPLGTFVEQRFDELWQQSKRMERFTHLPVTLVDATDGRREFSCRFVYVDDCLYVAGHDLVS